MAKRKRDTIDLKEWIDLHGTDFVVKVRNGKPYISKKPKRDPARKKSEPEQKQVNLFKLAVQHARDVIADEEKSAEYKSESKQSGRSIYHLAIADYIAEHRSEKPKKKLEYDEILAEKTGAHLFLKINLKEPVPFTRLEVSLHELDMTPVEQGNAEQVTVSSWWYLIKNTNIFGLPFRARFSAESTDGVRYEADYVVL